MDYVVVIVPVAPVRRKPRHQQEMVSQLLFGETVKVLKQKGANWLKIRSLHDGYEGWITRSLLEETDKTQALKSPAVFTVQPVTRVVQESAIYWLPAGAVLNNFTDGQFRVNDRIYHADAEVVTLTDLQANRASLEMMAHSWLNAPYMWGGRTMLGVDCSGFAQLLFRFMGVALPRDAWQQAQEGEVVEKLAVAKAGDLVFFDDKDEIVHVGVLLSNTTVIHASGNVRIDPIDKKGILHAQTGKRTHRLKAIRRYW